MTETAALIAFLNACLEEDASFAAATFRPGGPRWSEVGRGERIPEMGHIARHDPARALREVEAKRSIMTFAAGLNSLNPGHGDFLLEQLAAVYPGLPASISPNDG